MNDDTGEPQNNTPSLHEEVSTASQATEQPLHQEKPELQEVILAEPILTEAQQREAEEITRQAEAAKKAEQEALAARTTFHLLPDVFTLMRLPVQVKQIPDFVWRSSFYTISRSPDELSIVCEERLVVRNIDHYGLGNIARIDGNWRILRLGVLDLSLVGIAARFSGILAEAGVNINIISTFDTDYVMIKQGKLAKALTALREAGYVVE